MAEQKNIILITGGNGGIGYETARQLLDDANNTVIIGSRSASKGEAAMKELKSSNSPGTIESVQLEVTDPASIEAAAKKIEAEHGRVDVLINNAAQAQFPEGTSLADMMNKTFAVNVTGPTLMVETFAPLLKKSRGARIVNVSSGVGSITERLNPKSPIYGQISYHYRSSKAALNMISATHHVVYGAQGMKVFTVDPGFTVSNLSTGNRDENGAKATCEGARPIVEAARGLRDHQAGKYFAADREWPW